MSSGKPSRNQSLLILQRGSTSRCQRRQLPTLVFPPPSLGLMESNYQSYQQHSYHGYPVSTGAFLTFPPPPLPPPAASSAPSAAAGSSAFGYAYSYNVVGDNFAVVQQSSVQPDMAPSLPPLPGIYYQSQTNMTAPPPTTGPSSCQWNPAQVAAPLSVSAGVVGETNVSSASCSSSVSSASSNVTVVPDKTNSLKEPVVVQQINSKRTVFPLLHLQPQEAHSTRMSWMRGEMSESFLAFDCAAEKVNLQAVSDLDDAALQFRRIYDLLKDMKLWCQTLEACLKDVSWRFESLQTEVNEARRPASKRLYERKEGGSPA